MSLELELLALLETINKNKALDSACAKLALSLMDLTLLDENASEEALALLTRKANANQVAAICVLPMHLSKTNSTACKRATVVNFPHGEDTHQKTESEIDEIISKYHPNEIDYVFAYKTYLNGQSSIALERCEKAYARCLQHNVTFKVIIETGAFKDPEIIYHLSKELIDTGCDFIKTSTGKITQGATPMAAFCMLKAIKDSKKACGIKVSGGIKTKEQAFLYMDLARLVINRKLDKSWFRIGASSLLDDLQSV